VRQKMVAEPELFFQSLHQQAESPEARWRRDLRIVEHILLRLIKTAEVLLSPSAACSKNAAYFQPLTMLQAFLSA